jgi:hypothetical protein
MTTSCVTITLLIVSVIHTAICLDNFFAETLFEALPHTSINPDTRFVASQFQTLDEKNQLLYIVTNQPNMLVKFDLVRRLRVEYIQLTYSDSLAGCITYNSTLACVGASYDQSFARNCIYFFNTKLLFSAPLKYCLEGYTEVRISCFF